MLEDGTGTGTGTGIGLGGAERFRAANSEVGAARAGSEERTVGWGVVDPDGWLPGAPTPLPK